ncbi:TPA: type II toxin-antitoxin system PemK/MazF family toxin [Clostridium botulinum]|nr:type II toxin-antitoxin system PemK/MazF family toxin [Clostridium botulinum]
MACPDVPKNPTRSSHYQKGSIHYYEPLGLSNNINTIKVRPYIVIGRTNHKSSRIILSPISDITKYVENGKVKYPYHVPLLKKDFSFLDKDSIILLDQIYTVSKNELWEEWYIGGLTNFSQLDNAIIYNFDLYESILEGINGLLSQYKPSYSNKFSRK